MSSRSYLKGSEIEKRQVIFCQCGDHAAVSLTNGYVVIFDTFMAGVVSSWNWYAKSDGKHRITAARNHHYYNGLLMCTYTVYLSHVLFPLPPGMEIDFKDKDGLNMKRENMRAATHGEKKAIGKRSINGATSRFRGVSAKGKKYASLIVHRGQTYNLGVFDTEIDAAIAYDKKAIELRGTFCILNFPDA